MTKKHEQLKKVLGKIGKYSTAWEIRPVYKKMFGIEFSNSKKDRKNRIEDIISARITERKAAGFFHSIEKPKEFLTGKGIAYAGNNKRFLFGLPEWENKDEYLPTLDISKINEVNLVNEIKKHPDVPLLGLHAWKYEDGSKFKIERYEKPYGFVYKLVFSDGMKYIGKKVFKDNWEHYYGSGTSIVPHLKQLHENGESLEIERYVLKVCYLEDNEIGKEKLANMEMMEQVKAKITDDKKKNRELGYLNNRIGQSESSSNPGSGSSTEKNPPPFLTYIIEEDSKFPLPVQAEILSVENGFMTIRIPIDVL